MSDRDTTQVRRLLRLRRLQGQTRHGAAAASILSPRHATHAIRTQVDPDVYVVLDEKLFLFSNAEARTAFENEEPGIVQVADGKWAELESERAQKKGCFSCF